MPRHTIVRELNAEDLERIEKLRKDAMCVFIAELLLWGCVLTILVQ